jgi:exonuclease SbcC
MRPHELTLRGFRSYRDEVTFDFRGRQLIGIVGPIGAGKSTILDAMAFALFGRTPRVQRDTKSLIHQLSDSAHVQLTFEVHGERWRATRALKRKGQGQAKLERLDDDGQPAETVTMDRQVKERIERLLGMDFDTFGRSVLLAQNEFATFLLAPDGPRNEVLKRVFGYERFDAALAVTKQRVARAEATLGELGREGDRVAQARAELAEAERAAVDAAAMHQVLEALLPKVRELDATIQDAKRSAEEAAVLTERLERLQAKAPSGDEVAEVRDGCVQAAGAVEIAAEDVARAAAAVEEAEAARTAAAEAVSELEPFLKLVIDHGHRAAAVTAAEEALERAREAERQAEAAIAEAAAVVAAAVAAHGTAEAAEADARDALGKAEEALHAARHAEIAMSLRAELVEHDPCPVCGQVVTTLPRATKAATVQRAEKARATAAAKLEKATKEREAASARGTRADADAAAATAERDRCSTAASEADAVLRAAEDALATTKSALADRLGAGDLPEGDPELVLEERRGEQRRAEAAARERQEEAAAARARHDAARSDLERATRSVAALREGLIAVWAQLETDADLELTDDPPSLVAAEVRLRDEVAAQVERAAAASRDAGRQGDTARDARVALLADAELEPGVDVEELATEARVRAATTEERREGLAKIVAAGADLDDRLEDERSRLAFLTRLRDDLQPSRFLKWLLAEERAALAENASVHLEALTDGAFRFTDDETFRIVDVNAAGAERDPDSLSGGETFLASLALALALADMVTRGGGRLDSFFLDEGFGSLDPEHIDRAMAGIEHLVGDGSDRLVILVSHVPQMHEIMEDLIVLAKDEVAGSSRVLEGAARA